MMLNNFPNTFGLLQIHLGDAYSTTWGNQRDTFYNVTGTPTAWFDGTIKCEGAYTNVQQMYNWYLGKYNARRATATDVSVYVTAVQQSGATFTIRACVCLDPGGTAKTVRVYIAHVLDNWPTNPSYSRNCFKQATTTQDVALVPGQCVTVTRTMTFDSTSWSHQSDIRLVAWAQAPNAAAPANVYNAGLASWPFPPDCNANGIPDATDLSLGYELDCNLNGTLDSCDIAGGTSLDLNGNGIPDECEEPQWDPGDLDCSGTVDFGDINPFVLALSNPAAYEATYPDCEPLNGDIDGNGALDFGDINPFVSLLSNPG